MVSDVWLPLSSDERNLLRDALAAYAAIDTADRKHLKALLSKIEKAQPLRNTVLRVDGGSVDVENNPNEVLVYDYDCDGVEDEYLSPDEVGRFCNASEYPPV